MASHQRIFNATTQRYIKRNQALGRIDQCLSVWVEENSSIRDLSLAEMVQARSAKARMEEALPFAEIPGLVWQHEDSRTELRLAAEANKFASEYAA